MTHKLETKVVKKAPLCTSEERQFTDPPYTVFLSPSMRTTESLTMKVGGLRQMLEGLDDDDSFRIQWFAESRATEYSYIKKTKK